MRKPLPLLLLLLLAYTMAPGLYDWIVANGGSWYRPFLLWVLVIVLAYLWQERNENS